MAEEVEIKELAHFIKSVRKADGDTAKKVREANRDLADKFVVRAQAAAAGVGRQAVKAAATLRASNTLTLAQIKGGSARVPFFYGAEFGSKRFKQFRAWRGNQSENVFEGGAGYFLFPSIRASQDLVYEDYSAAILAAAGDAFK